MKFTFSWLKDYLETDISLDEVATSLTEIGLEVEEITNPIEDLKEFIIAKILSSKKHPDADKLKICEVDIGIETKEVVCGAPNAKEGLTTIYAPIGSVIPKTKMKIKKAKIRGVTSYGMLCSGEELNIDNDFDGIIELDDEKPGEKVINVLDNIDPIIEIAITPNRPDCLGVYGIARDLSLIHI